MATGALAALIALEQGQSLDLNAINAAWQQDITNASGNTATGSTPILDAILAGSSGSSGSGSTPAFNFNDYFPDTIPMSALSATSAVTPTSLEDPGSSPVATGFPLFRETFDMLMQAEQARMQSVDQGVRLAQLFTDLRRASPTQAAELATMLGLPDMEPDLEWLNRFSEGAHSTIGGQIGTQHVRLPWSLSGSHLSFLNSNPNVANVLGDVADFLGKPDIFSTSQQGLVPTSGSVASWAF